MSLTPDDREWFSGKLGPIYGSLDELKQRATRSETLLEAHTDIRIPCAKVAKHEGSHHSVSKGVAMAAGAVGVAAAVIGMVMAFMH